MPTITVIKPTKALDSKNTTDKNPRRKVAGYARVSTEKDEQYNSYEAQVAYYTNYIKENPDWDFVKVYTDEGITGTNIKSRTGFQQMINDALDGKIDLIVTKSVSRFARNTIDSLQTIRKLKEHNVEVYFEKENIWTFDGKGELLITIMSSLAQEESRSISENVTWGMRESMRQGKAWVPFSSFLGYDKGPNETWIINPEQAVLVRRIYGMYLQGMSPYHIGKVLETEGHKLPNGRSIWYSTTIASILQNEKYTGDALRQKTYTSDFLSKKKMKNDGKIEQYYIKDHHEAIISHETFDLVQKEYAIRGNKERIKTGNRLFSYHIKCGNCGNWYGPYIATHGVNKGKIVWRCNHKYNKEKYHCSPPKVNKETVKNAIIQATNTLLHNSKNLLDICTNSGKKLFCIDGYMIEKKETESEIQKAKNTFKYAGKNDINHLDRRLYYAAERIKEISKILDGIKKKRNESIDYIQGIMKQNHIVEFDERLLIYLIDYVTIENDKKITVAFSDGTKVTV